MVKNQCDKIIKMDQKPERTLATLKMKIELFDPQDIDAGVWAYYQVAKALGQVVIRPPRLNQ